MIRSRIATALLATVAASGGMAVAADQPAEPPSTDANPQVTEEVLEQIDETQVITEQVIDELDTMLKDVPEGIREQFREAIRRNDTLKKLRVKAASELLNQPRGSKTFGRMFVIGPDGGKMSELTFDGIDVELDAAEGLQEAPEAVRSYIKILNDLPSGMGSSKWRVETKHDDGTDKPSVAVQTHMSGRVIVIGPDGKKREVAVVDEKADFDSYKKFLKNLENVDGLPKGISETLQKSLEVADINFESAEPFDKVELHPARVLFGNRTSLTGNADVIEKLDQLLERIDSLEKKVDALTNE